MTTPLAVDAPEGTEIDSVPMFEPPAALGAGRVGLPVSDVGRAAEWFNTVLGFRTAPRGDEPRGTVIVTHPSGASVALSLAPARAAATSGFPAMSLRVGDKADLESLAAHLGRCRVIHTPPFPAQDGWALRLWGPDMVQVRVTSR
jgi:hypothetical protein